eukprot:Em0018g141a
MPLQLDRGGLPLNCSSERALELFNKALHASLSTNESFIQYLREACELDSGFVLVHCMLGSFWLSSSTPPSHPNVSTHLEAVKSPDPNLTSREKAHIAAMQVLASGNRPKAAEMWRAILVDHPKDVVSIRLLFYACIDLAEFMLMRDYLAAVLPWWTEEDELYPFILSYYAFALEQTNQRDRAEHLARKALDLQKKTPWAYHTLSHVIEEERETVSGVEFLTSSRENWKGSYLNGHITWHLALYYLDQNNFSELFHEFDTVLCSLLEPDDLYGLVDAISLLWRLNVAGVEAGEERWKKITDVCAQHVENCTFTWFNLHVMMSLAHGKVSESAARLVLAERLLKSISEYAKSNTSTDCKVADVVGVPVGNALLAFGKGQYSEVISLMLPLKYDLVKLGGSWAQRQVFSVTLIHAAIRSKQLPLALALIAELRAMKPKSRTLDKLYKEIKGLCGTMEQGPIRIVELP